MVRAGQRLFQMLNDFSVPSGITNFIWKCRKPGLICIKLVNTLLTFITKKENILKWGANYQQRGIWLRHNLVIHKNRRL